MSLKLIVVADVAEEWCGEKDEKVLFSNSLGQRKSVVKERGKMKTPELDKMVKVKEDSQRIGEFLEWLESQEIILAEWTGYKCVKCGDYVEGPVRISQTREQLLANYFCIDLDKAEKERRALLDDIRAQNRKDNDVPTNR